MNDQVMKLLIEIEYVKFQVIKLFTIIHEMLYFNT
jgi:hypothetical protein